MHRQPLFLEGVRSTRLLDHLCMPVLMLFDISRSQDPSDDHPSGTADFDAVCGDALAALSQSIVQLVGPVERMCEYMATVPQAAAATETSWQLCADILQRPAIAEFTQVRCSADACSTMR